jgi:DNA-binding transcriptional MerR regulator
MFSIGQVSSETRLKVPTIRYYEEIKLIKVKARSPGNQRRYSSDDLKRLTFIKHARELGFSIDSVRQLLDLSDSGLNNCSDIDDLASNQLLEVRKKIDQLKRLEHELGRMVAGCGDSGSDQCYVIESLSNHALCIGEHAEQK